MINEHWQFDRVRIDRRSMRDENVMKRHLYTSIERNQHETHQSIQWEKKKVNCQPVKTIKSPEMINSTEWSSMERRLPKPIIMERRLLKPSEWSIQLNDHHMKRRLSKPSYGATTPKTVHMERRLPKSIKLVSSELTASGEAKYEGDHVS